MSTLESRFLGNANPLTEDIRQLVESFPVFSEEIDQIAEAYKSSHHTGLVKRYGPYCGCSFCVNYRDDIEANNESDDPIDGSDEGRDA